MTRIAKYKRESLICINNIKQSLEELRDVINDKLNHNQAEKIDIELVRKLRRIEENIRESL